jgi:hypothetical protein
MRYQTFEQAQTALDQQLLTPFQRGHAQQLINERRAAMKEAGAEEIKARRQKMKETSAKHTSRYEGATTNLEFITEAIEDGDVPTDQAQRLLADAKRTQAKLSAGSEPHLGTLGEWSEPESPEAFGIAEWNRLVAMNPALRSEGRAVNDPLEFDW